MNFKKYHVSKNLFDYSTTEIGSISTTDGSDVEYDYARRSDFIPVQAGVTYTFSGLSGNIRIFEYKPDKTYRNTNYLYTIPVKISRTGYIRISGALTSVIPEIMLNEGDTALPYEPYSSEVWHDIPHYIHNTSTDTLTTPANIYANDTTATVGLKGNMVQSGTPTPDSPIMPQGTGDKTANLSPPLDNWTAGFLNYQGVYQSAGSVTLEKISDYVPIESSTTYSFSREDGFPAGSDVAWCAIGFFNANKEFINRPSANSASFLTATSPNNAKYCRMMYRTYGQTKEPILNASPYVLPFEPFGYKIPILCGNQTTNIYLGETQSTRAVKKLVLTGNENISEVAGIYYAIPVNNVRAWVGCLCSHCEYGGIIGGNTNISLWAKKEAFTDYPTITDFKAYLAQQYIAGTPVTIWYVLATPETAIINEPLMKIGDYADEVSGITIPVTAGTNTISIGTTLQPSEVTATYKGWHPVQSVHERDNGAWD